MEKRKLHVRVSENGRADFGFDCITSLSDLDIIGTIADTGCCSQWCPIETAPKDGTPIIGRANGEITIVKWVEWLDGGIWMLSVCGKHAEDGEWWPTEWKYVPGR